MSHPKQKAKKVVDVEIEIVLAIEHGNIPGLYPVEIIVSKDEQQACIPTGIQMTEECFDDMIMLGFPVGHPDYAAWIHIARYVEEVVLYLQRRHIYRVDPLLQEIAGYGEEVDVNVTGNLPELRSWINHPATTMDNLKVVS